MISSPCHQVIAGGMMSVSDARCKERVKPGRERSRINLNPSPQPLAAGTPDQAIAIGVLSPIAESVLRLNRNRVIR
jgi:hypothetical protein